MFNVIEIEIDAFVKHLQQIYHRTFGGLKRDYGEIIGWAGTMALENIANSDALYHDVDHTVLVTLVGQQVLRGKHIRGARVTAEEWLHYTVSLLCHDIGYVSGVCRADQDGAHATGIGDSTIQLPRGSTDAALAPFHVDRGKLFMQERFAGHEILDVELITSCIELTRFPVPTRDDHQDTTGLPGLVRAADLIGQLSDPRYLNKIPALFYEFEETGINAKLGYKTPLDLRRNYPKFYWDGVFPYIKDGLRYLSLTQQGKQIGANLFSNVFQVEHEKTGGTGSTGSGS